MNYRMLNAVRDIQVLLKEAGVYPGSIDGAWGKGTAGGVVSLFEDYHLRVNGGRTNPLPISLAGGEAGALQGVKDVQSNLKLFKLYDGSVDGISGMGTNTWGGFFKVFSSYRAYNKLPMYDVAWSKKVGPEFIKKIKDWCKKWDLWPEAASALMACICFETGGTFSPTIRNKAGAYYFGLIQFGKDAALDLSRVYNDPRVTVDWLITLSQLEQLDWVFKYFEMWMKRGKKYTRLEDFYLTIFYPAAVGKKPDEIIFRRDVEKERLGYTQNRGFDFNNDGAITVGEINTRLYTTYYDGLLPTNRVVSTTLY